MRTLPFPVRRPTFAEVKRVHSKLATLYHPLLVSDTAKLKPSIDVASPTSSNKVVTSVDSIANTNSMPNETSGEITEETIDYPDTRIKLQLDSTNKQLVDKKGKLVMLSISLL